MQGRFAILFGMVLSWKFLAYPNLALVIIGHAALGTMLHRVTQLHMKIGPMYGLDGPHSYVTRHLLPFVKELIGGRW